ncbi:hypothetical protein BC827DRAFT_1229300 [Russula dissimulans]|nr:hypothetical protein BC827DRAFT_1229300 [Russula dissimulans]
MATWSVSYSSVSVFELSVVPGPQPQRPHPAAPEQFKEAFAGFLEKYKRTSSQQSNNSALKNPRGLTFDQFWEAPNHLWRPRIRHVEDTEIDAVLSGGASLR